MFIAQDAKEDKDYNYCYLHCQQHVYHIISDRCTSSTISIDHHSRATLDNGKGGGGLPITRLEHTSYLSELTAVIAKKFGMQIQYNYEIL